MARPAYAADPHLTARIEDSWSSTSGYPLQSAIPGRPAGQPEFWISVGRRLRMDFLEANLRCRHCERLLYPPVHDSEPLAGRVQSHSVARQTPGSIGRTLRDWAHVWTLLTWKIRDPKAAAATACGV